MCMKQISYILLVSCLCFIHFTSSKDIKKFSVDFEYEIKDDNSFGIMDVNIYNPYSFRCGVDVIRLYVNESIANKTECSEDISFDSRYHTQFSSCEKLKVCQKNKISKSCTENITAEYLFIFTGCYQIQIVKRDRPIMYTAPFWVESLYRKEELSKTAPTSYIKRNLLMNTTNIFLKYSRLDMLLLQNTMYFETFDNSSKLLKSYCVKWNIGHKVASKTGFSENEIVNISGNCGLQTYDPAEECTFDPEGKLIDCLFNVPNFSIHKITLDVPFSDTPCSGTSLWGKLNRDCRWEVVSKSSNERSNYFITKEPKFPLYKVTVPIAVFFICVLCLFIYVKWFHSEFYLFIKRKRQIFLLYPRDCEEPIPDIIQRFAKLLNDLGNFEIYDIWDSRYFESISLSATQWVQHKIAEADFIFYIPTKRGEALYEFSVTFNGDIGKLQQEFCISGGEAFDHYFPYAYKLASIKSNFINIEFSELTKELNNSVMKSNGTTFKIPKQFTKLCKKLRIYRKNCTQNNEYLSMVESIKEAKSVLSDKEDNQRNSLMECAYKSTTSQENNRFP